MLFVRTWSKHELLFTYFLDNTSIRVCRIGLPLFQAKLTYYWYSVVTVIWSLPVLKMRQQVESQKRQKDHRRAQDDIWEAHCISFGSHSNKHIQPLMADQQGVMGTSAVTCGSHSSIVDKRTLNKSFQLVIFIQCWLKWFFPLIFLLCDMYTTSFINVDFIHQITFNNHPFALITFPLTAFPWFILFLLMSQWHDFHFFWAVPEMFHFLC